MNTKTNTIQTRSEFHEVETGHFVQRLLPGSTIVYKVIRVTDKTITVQETTTGKTVLNDNQIIYSEALTKTDGYTRNLRLRKNGTFRMGDDRYNLTLAREIDGVPVKKMNTLNY